MAQLHLLQVWGPYTKFGNRPNWATRPAKSAAVTLTLVPKLGGDVEYSILYRFGWNFLQNVQKIRLYMYVSSKPAIFHRLPVIVPKPHTESCNELASSPWGLSVFLSLLFELYNYVDHLDKYTVLQYVLLYSNWCFKTLFSRCPIFFFTVDSWTN